MATHHHAMHCACLDLLCLVGRRLAVSLIDTAYFYLLEGTLIAVSRGKGTKSGDAPRPTQLEIRLAVGGVVARATLPPATAAKRSAELHTGAKLRVTIRSVDLRRGYVEVDVV